MNFPPWALLLPFGLFLYLLALFWAVRSLNTTQRNISYLEKAKSLDWSWPKDPQVAVFFIQTCEQEIKKLRHRRNSTKYADLQKGMGMAYFRLLIGDRTANLERAISCYQEALRFQTPETDPLGYAATYNGMGMAYAAWPTGDRTANLERAISCYQEALRFQTPETDPLSYATTQTNLGMAYNALPTGDRAANLERAISCHREALRFQTPETDPHVYAIIQINLGITYWNLSKAEDQTVYLERAISCYQEALRFQTPETDPLSYAAVQNDLGLVYDTLATGDRTANLEQAISCYQEALRFWMPETAPHMYALAQNNLGKAYNALPTGDRVANLERAISCCQEALRFLTPETDPFHYCRTNRRLGDIYFAQREWQAALDVYQAAMLVDERLYQAGLSTESKAAEIAENATIYPHAAYAAFHCGRITEALDILERGKTRVLAEALRLRIARPASISDEVWNAFESAAAAVRVAQFEDAAPSDEGQNLVQAYEAHEQSVQVATAALDSAIEQIRLLAPNFLRTIDLSDIHALLPDEHTALVTFCITDQGSVGFVVSSNHEVQTIEMPTFTQTKLAHLLVELDTDGEVIGGWIGAYADFLYEHTPTTLDTWQTTISKTLVEIGQDLLVPILSSLSKELERIIFLPSSELFLLPLHAAPLSGNGSERICDRYQISYAPSIEVLVNIRAKATNEVIPELYAVINPEADPRLVFSLTEGTAIASLFEKHTVDKGGTGTKQHVIDGMQKRSYIHFSCHGSYNWSDPLYSGLALADGQLTLSELQQGRVDLSTTRLVTLSACETGMINVTGDSPEEYVGIPAGFLLAGIPCVISSLWSVPDLSTALLMERFYQNHLTSKMDFAEALREAQVWVRELSIRVVVTHIEQCYEQGQPEERSGFLRYLRYYRHQAEVDPTLCPFAHPYYWAAFTVNGM